MNIFVLDASPVLAAQMQCNKHIVKMPLESAQMLSTLQRHCGNDNELLYKSSYYNHPCNVWLRESLSNYEWLVEHFNALCAEYTRRYGRVHKTTIINSALVSPALPDIGLTPFKLCMPDKYKVENDAVQSYRNYYLGDKAYMAYWFDKQPDWFSI